MDDRPRRFAILEHRWRGSTGTSSSRKVPVLRAWAVDAPIEPGADLPARSLPDHRPIYLEYQGEISGGRGVVERWDSGLCDVLEWGEDRVRLAVRGVQLVGLVEFRRVVDAGPLRWLFRFGKLS